MSLILFFTEDAYEGDAQVSVALNDAVVIPSVSITAAHGSAPMSVAVPDGPAGPTYVTVTFLNDAFGGSGPGQDRNAYLVGASYGGVAIAMTEQAMRATGDKAAFEFVATATVPAAPAAPVAAVVPVSADVFNAGLASILVALAGIRAQVAALPASATGAAAVPTPSVLPVVTTASVAWTVDSWRAQAKAQAANYPAPAPALFTLAAGIYRDSFAGTDTRPAITLSAASPAWPPNVVFDGADHAWGKAALVCFGPHGSSDVVGTNPTAVTIIGIAARNITAASSDGTAGMYGDINSDVVMRGCEFSGNNDGVFTNASCQSVLIEDSMFGLVSPNGCPDQHSHNLYSMAVTTTVQRCVGAPAAQGNNLKIRSPTCFVDSCILFSGDGRFVDRPDGGAALVSNCLLVQIPTSASSQMFGMAEETTVNFVPNDPTSSTITYRNCDIWVQAECAVMCGAGATIDFDACRWHFVKSTQAGRPTSLTVAGALGGTGTVKGLPFALAPDGVSMPIPDSAWETKPAPAMPQSPYDLPGVLAANLPGPMV